MTELALTFNGIIPLIPDILIDNFESLHEKNVKNRHQIKYCIISHAHSDHYKGLLKQIIDPPLFILTKTTKDLIYSQSNLTIGMKRNLSNSIFLKMNNSIQLELNLNLTFIPNYHCLGSVMILIEDSRNNKNINILYSGDARFDDSVICSIKNSTFLLPYLYDNKLIDLLYLDTTFAYRSKNIEIPENIKGIYQLIKLIEKYPNGTNFKFQDSTYGFEEVWCKISDYFGNNCKFQISKRHLNWIIKLQSDYNVKSDDLETNVNIVDKIHKLNTTNNDNNVRYTFYIGDIREFNIARKDKIVYIKHAIDLTKDEYENIYLPKDFNQFDKIECNNKDTFNDIWDGKFWYLNGNQKQLLHFSYIKNPNYLNLFLPTHLKFIYSRHSSYSETKKFVEIFKDKIKDIYPMTESFDTWHKGFNMKNFFNIENSTYDKIRRQTYGCCNVKLRSFEGNLQIMDYWNSSIDNNKIDEDIGIIKSFDSVSTDIDFDFDPLGQDIRNQGQHLSFDNRKKELVAFKGNVIQTQIKEKRRRNDRFLQNTDTKETAEFGNVENHSNNNDNDNNDNNNNSMKHVQFIKIDYENITDRDNNELKSNKKLCTDKKKIMKMTPTVQNLMDRLFS
ncbi:hypothetical protein C6P40_004918 [Pichia californica]|uniref:Metallo-beta-lactamase domain-containing protein n=1 Tax=Pichia californica TaxID=460514 RepID=A0A9P6WM16_9ASCO|nr:hypothetical protein C6P40_004918 [[Candida] californica]